MSPGPFAVTIRQAYLPCLIGTPSAPETTSVSREWREEDNLYSWLPDVPV